MGNLIVDSEYSGLSTPKKFLAYSDAYCNAAIELTNQMVSYPKQATWAKAAVVLMLSAHSVELLLKGMLFHKNPKIEVNNTHDLEKLYRVYQHEFLEPKYRFDMPFKTEFPEMSKAEIGTLKNMKGPPAPSILYRYPTRTGSAEWEGAYGFEANSYIGIIHTLSKDIERLKEFIT